MSEKTYRTRLMVAMVGYMAAVVLALPAARSAPVLPAKVALAVVPVLPMLYVIWLMAQRVRGSDEFEQRVHLIALGAASAVVAAASLLAGFLAAARVPGVDGPLFLWVFPTLMLVYSAVRWWVSTRHYGTALECEGGQLSWRLRLALLAALTGIVLAHAWWHHRMSSFDIGLLVGMGGALLVLALSRAVATLREKRMGRER